MKKYLALLLVLVLTFSLVACGGGASGSSSAVDEPAAEPVAEEPSSVSESPESTAGGEYPDFTGRELVLGVWGGTFAEHMLEACAAPFEELTGATITFEEYGSDVVAKVIAQEEQGIEGYDMISGCGALDQVYLMDQAGAVIDLDYSLLPNADNIPDDAKFDFAVGQYTINTFLAWRSDVYGDNPPDTVEKYYDVENYPGNRGMIGFSPSGVLEQALLAQGVAVDDLYPIDLDKAYEYLDIIKPHVTKWWTSGAEVRQALADGEVDCGYFWGGAVVEGIMRDGMDNVEISHSAASLIVDCFAITSSCEDTELAHAFLNYCLSAEAQAAFSMLRFYAPTNPDALALIDEDYLQYFSSADNETDKAFWCDVPYWQENFETFTEQYLNWIAS